MQGRGLWDGKVRSERSVIVVVLVITLNLRPYPRGQDRDCGILVVRFFLAIELEQDPSKSINSIGAPINRLALLGLGSFLSCPLTTILFGEV